MHRNERPLLRGTTVRVSQLGSVYFLSTSSLCEKDGYEEVLALSLWSGDGLARQIGTGNIAVP